MIFHYHADCASKQYIIAFVIVVNHFTYADDCLLYSRSAKYVKPLLIYVMAGVQDKSSNSLAMYFDYTRKRCKGIHSREKFNSATSRKNLGRVICNDLFDGADIEAKLKLRCANSNMLHQQFIFYSSIIKNKMCKTDFSNLV